MASVAAPALRGSGTPKMGARSPSMSGTPPPAKLPRSVSPAAGAPARPTGPAVVAGVSDSAIGGDGGVGRTGDGATPEGGAGNGPLTPGGRFGGNDGGAGATGGGWGVACARRKCSSATGRMRAAPSAVAGGEAPASPPTAMPQVGRSTKPNSGRQNVRPIDPTLPSTTAVSP